MVCLAVAAAAALAGALWLERTRREVGATEQTWRTALGQLSPALERQREREQLARADLAQLKNSFSGTAKQQKDLFESGLSLQEERRLLEKQWEIMTTSLLINPPLQRVFLLRDDQPLASYLIRYIPLRAFAGAPTALPPAVRIVSKERFAHPERGKAEMVNDQLVWTPPQVGSSTRSRALGEFVMFTTSKLILHGPPVSDDDHALFPHVCLGLDLTAAQRLYRTSFIGTRIALANVVVEAAPLPEGMAPASVSTAAVSVSSGAVNP